MNTNALDNIILKYTKWQLIGQERDKLICSNFKQLSQTDKLSRPKVSKDIKHLNNTLSSKTNRYVWNSVSNEQ